MKKSHEALAAASMILGIPLLFLVVTIPMVAIKAFVVMKFWGWFVVPVFGLPPVSLVYMMGIVLMVHAMFPRPQVLKDAEPFWTSVCSGVAILFIVFGIGYVLSLFV